MASELFRGVAIDTPTLLAILLERAGGSVTIPEDAAIAMADRNADVVVLQHPNGDLQYILQDKGTLPKELLP